MLFRKQNNKKQISEGRQPRFRTIDVPQNKAFLYHNSRSQSEINIGRSIVPDEQSKLRRRTRFVLTNAPIIIACIVIAACVLDGLTLSTTPKVVPLTTSKSQIFLRKNSEYQHKAEQLFSASLTNNNKLTVDTQGVSKAMEKAFPELSDVSVTLPLLGHKPIVYIQPSDPALILSTHNGNFVIDTNGRALLPAYTVSNLADLRLPKVIDQSGLKFKPGQAALSSNDTAFISNLIVQLRSKGYSLDKTVLLKASRELDVYPSSKQYFVKFNMQNDVRQQAGSFIAVAKQLSSKGTTPSQYIDVRIDGRVYYK